MSVYGQYNINDHFKQNDPFSYIIAFPYRLFRSGVIELCARNCLPKEFRTVCVANKVRFAATCLKIQLHDTKKYIHYLQIAIYECR